MVLEEVFNKKYGKEEGLWRSKGKNHIVTEEGFIRRTLDEKESFWTISIADLSDLIELNKKYGNIILSEHWFTLYPKIEIYDDYRE